MSGNAVHSFGVGLGQVPRVEDVRFAQVQGERRATKIADRDRVRRSVGTVLACAELIDLTQQRAPLF